MMYRRFNLIFTYLAVLGVVLLSFFAFGLHLHSKIFPTLLAWVFTVLLTASALFNFSKYVGPLNLGFVFFILFFCFSVAFFFSWFFGFDFYVELNFFVFLFVFLYFILLSYIGYSFSIFNVAYIDVGRVKILPNVRGVKWNKIESPSVDIKFLKKNIVMADLRANLSSDWELFLARCALDGIPVYHSSRLIESLSGRVKIDHLYENNLGSLLPSKGYIFFKRIIDISLILISLPLVLPVALAATIVIPLESNGGVFFVQERVGKGGKPFKVYKFRSMCASSESDGEKFAAENDMRITRVGRIIRKTRIDELPQFINVLKGDMSLIGPRPEQVKFVNKFREEIPFYDYRHIVKPGISGWAQVVHGYAENTEDTRVKLEHDFYYIKNFSFSLDMLIVFKTVQTMLTGFGAR